MRGTDFIKAIIDSVEKVKNTLTTYTRTASNSSVDKTSPEFTKMKNGLLNTQVVLGFQIKPPTSIILWASNSNLSTIIAGKAARDKDTFVHWVAAGSVQGARGRRRRREHQRNRQEEEEKVVLTCSQLAV